MVSSPLAPSSIPVRHKIARALPFHATSLESALLQVFIPLHLKSPRISVYKKPGGGSALSLTRNPMKGVCPERPSGVRTIAAMLTESEMRSLAHAYAKENGKEP
jgi:hypothetical protein